MNLQTDNQSVSCWRGGGAIVRATELQDRDYQAGQFGTATVANTTGSTATTCGTHASAARGRTSHTLTTDRPSKADTTPTLTARKSASSFDCVQIRATLRVVQGNDQSDAQLRGTLRLMLRVMLSDAPLPGSQKCCMLSDSSA